MKGTQRPQDTHPRVSATGVPQYTYPSSGVIVPGYNTQTSERKYLYDGKPPSIDPTLANELHNIPAASHGSHNARIEAARGAYKLQKPQKSFGGGVDGKGRPLFASLETSKGKHMADGYEDMGPPEGPFGSMFKRYLNAKNGNSISGGL